MLKFKNRKGSAIITALGVTALVIIFGVLISNLLVNNAIAARRQREVTQAYYLTLAGLEIGTATVLQRGLDDSFPVLEHFRTYSGNFTNLYFTEIVRFSPGGPMPGGIPALPDYNWSKIEIWIYATNRAGERLTGVGSSGTVWVEVLARGTFYNASEWAAIQADPTLDGQIGTSHAARIRFNTVEPQWFIRRIENPNALPNGF